MNYIKNMRAKVGHDPIFMPASSGFIYHDGKILLQLRSDSHKWAATGGCMEFGETSQETLCREMKEELGIMPLDPQLVGAYAGEEAHHVYPNQDEVYLVIAIYLITKYEGEPKADLDEVAKLKWFSIDELPTRSEFHLPDWQALLDTVEYVRRHLLAQRQG